MERLGWPVVSACPSLLRWPLISVPRQLPSLSISSLPITDPSSKLFYDTDVLTVRHVISEFFFQKYLKQVGPVLGRSLDGRCRASQDHPHHVMRDEGGRATRIQGNRSATQVTLVRLFLAFEDSDSHFPLSFVNARHFGNLRNSIPLLTRLQ